MGKYIWLRKAIVLSCIGLFLFGSVSPIFRSTLTPVENFSKKTEAAEKKSDQNVAVSCSLFGLQEKPVEQNMYLTYHDAEILLNTIRDLELEIAKNPHSEAVQQLQKQIFDSANTYGLLPKDFSVEHFFSEKNTNNGNTLYKKIVPVAQGKATEWLCSFVSTGSGNVLPIIILPRFIPFILTPIPRVFVRWNTQAEAITSCGGLRSGTGFIAYGPQKGFALGFWGIGFTFSLPPFLGTYGLIGYALYASTTAENIEFYPPNNPPQVNPMYPLDNAQYVPVLTTELSFHIQDLDGDLMSYSVLTDPDIGGGNGNLKPDGTYTIPVHGLESLTTYTWYVQVSDGMDTTQTTYSFTTEDVQPIISNIYPLDKETEVPISIDQLSFTLTDYQTDPMDYTVETVPDIGSGSGTDVSNGVYTIPISNLEGAEVYTWYVNVTDGTYWTRKKFVFETKYPDTFNPFEYGWLYRKQITIDNTKISEDLINFPVLISLVDSDLQQKARSDGNDILFMSSSGTAQKLNHEIETFLSTDGKLVAWVNISMLSSTEDTIFYMYYGKENCLSKENIKKTWDQYYVGVWHMADTIGDIKDSTGTQNGAVFGSLTYNQQGKGTMGNSLYFPGTDDNYVDITNNIYRFNTEDVTLEAWINIPENRNLYENIIYFGDNNDLYPQVSLSKYRSYMPYAAGLSAVRNYKIGGPNEQSYDDQIRINQWYFLAGKLERGVETALYINGSKVTHTESCTNNDVGAGTGFCAHIGMPGIATTYERFYKGYIDELRISKGIARSDAWISTTYMNQQSPLSFYSLGSEEHP